MANFTDHYIYNAMPIPIELSSLRLVFFFFKIENVCLSVSMDFFLKLSKII